MSEVNSIEPTLYELNNKVLASKRATEYGQLCDVAAQYLDSRRIDGIIKKAVAESLIVVADSSKSHSEIAAEKRKIVRLATKHVLTMAGSLLENIKADDKFFGE